MLTSTENTKRFGQASGFGEMNGGSQLDYSDNHVMPASAIT